MPKKKKIVAVIEYELLAKVKIENVKFNFDLNRNFKVSYLTPAELRSNSMFG